MNFLAHLYLSGDDLEIQAGNFFGDEIKGRNYTHLPEKVALGVTLHRFIDSHTDSNEKNLELKKVLYETFHKYAGIALDIYFDHFLAKKWNEYHSESLNDFTAGVYIELESYLPLFSKHSHRLFINMVKYDWLSGYGTMEGMEKTFYGMSKRLPVDSGMNHAILALEKHYSRIESGFDVYFPELSFDTKQKLIALSLIE